MYDAIVVGARRAGALTAMLLARKGYRVLLVDKATFPSDSINGYYIHQPGVARLKRWGLRDTVRQSNCPPLQTVALDLNGVTLAGSPPPFEDVEEGYTPRRVVLDKILVDAAVEAGVELRQRFVVQDLPTDGEQVVGIRGQTQSGVTVTEKARIVIGADGKHSLVARTVNAPLYNQRPALTCWYYTHWSNVPVSGLQFYVRGPRTIILGPTNNGCTVGRLATSRVSAVPGGYQRGLLADA